MVDVVRVEAVYLGLDECNRYFVPGLPIYTTNAATVEGFVEDHVVNLLCQIEAQLT